MTDTLVLIIRTRRLVPFTTIIDLPVAAAGTYQPLAPIEHWHFGGHSVAQSRTKHLIDKSVVSHFECNSPAVSLSKQSVDIPNFCKRVRWFLGLKLWS